MSRLSLRLLKAIWNSSCEVFLTSAAKYEGGKCPLEGLINTKCTQCGPDETAGALSSHGSDLREGLRCLQEYF